MYVYRSIGICASIRHTSFDLRAAELSVTGFDYDYNQWCWSGAAGACSWL